MRENSSDHTVHVSRDVYVKIIGMLSSYSVTNEMKHNSDFFIFSRTHCIKKRGM